MILKKVIKMSDEVSYSEAIQRLEEIVQSLERGGISLDETCLLYTSDAADD